MPFEFPPPLAGAGPTVTVLDPAGGPPSTIIDTDDPFLVRVDWSVDLPAAALLGGQWLVRVYAESIGPGQEVQIGTQAVSVGAGTAGPTSIAYRANIPVAAGTLQAESGASSGVYTIVAVVTHNGFLGPTVLAGFEQGPVIQMREP
jgi:hypothetical protein